MSDQRFAARLQKIESKQKSPRKAEPQLLAGVGDVKATRTSLKSSRPRLLPYIALGLIVGYASYVTLNELVGLEALIATPPEAMVNLALSDPKIGAAGGALAFSGALAFLSLFLGKRGAKARGFAWAAVVSAVGGAMVASI